MIYHFWGEITIKLQWTLCYCFWFTFPYFNFKEVIIYKGDFVDIHCILKLQQKKIHF